MRAQRHLRPSAEAAHMARGSDARVGDLLRRRLRVDLGVGDEQRAVLVDHQRQRADRLQAAARQHLADVVQVPQVLAEGAADQAVGLAAVHHHRADRGGVGAHDGAREIGRHAAPLPSARDRCPSIRGSAGRSPGSPSRSRGPAGSAGRRARSAPRSPRAARSGSAGRSSPRASRGPRAAPARPRPRRRRCGGRRRAPPRTPGA